MKENKNNTQMPDMLAPDHIKKLNDYGLQVAKAIQHEQFNGGKITSGCNFMGRNKFIEKMRLHNRAEQDDKFLKNIIGRDNLSLSKLNLDWTLINYPKKFTSIVINGIDDSWYNLDIRSLDRFTALEQNDKRIQLKADRMANKMLKNAKRILGIDQIPTHYIPNNDEELDLYMEIKERPQVEIAEQTVINFVKEASNWDSIIKRVRKDVVESGLIAVRIYTDPVDGVKLEYVDIETYGHSFVESNDFSDAVYHFVVDTIPLSQIKKESGYDDKVLRKIAKTYGAENGGYDLDFDKCDMNSVYEYRIQVMRFCFKTSKEIVAKRYLDKRNNLNKIAFRDSEYEVPEGAEKSRVSQALLTWYEGNYVIGSNEFIYGYRECENIARDSMNNPMPPFIVMATDIYKNRLDSFLNRIVPICKNLMYNHIKIQQLIAELRPDLIEIDIDQLADLTGKKKGGSPQEIWETAVSILNSKGIVIKKRVDMGEMGVKDGTSARPMPGQQGSGLAQALVTWKHYYDQIRELTGVNPAADGTISPDSLVGVNQMMQLAYNTVTKDIVNTVVDFDKAVCKTISSRIKTIYSLPEAKHLQDMYNQCVGRKHMNLLEKFKNRSLLEFGFSVEFIPSKQELDALNADMLLAIQEKTLDISEKQEIAYVARNDMKRARELMRFYRNRRIKEEMKAQQFNQQMQRKTNIEAAQAKAQSEIQSYGSKKQIDLEVKAKEAQIEVMKQKALKDMEQPYEDKKFQQEVYLTKISEISEINMKKYLEDRKDNRTKLQATQQSKIADQRAKDYGPTDFEDSFDFPIELN